MLGVDILNINRIRNLKKRDRFIKRVFTDNEREYIEAKNNSNQTIAGLFCAKEAVAKVFDTGLVAKLFFQDIEILHLKGAPYINTKLPKIHALMTEKGFKEIDISISHDGDMAIAIAMARPVFEVYPKIDKDLAKLMPERNEDFHKYDYGKVLVIGGKKGMHGSVTLAAKAAMRTGAGLTHLLLPSSIESACNQWLLETIVRTYPSDYKGEFAKFDREEFIQYIKTFDSIAFGPGIGNGEAAKDMLDIILTEYLGPLIIDADGINILSNLSFLDYKKKNIYLTPHEKEFSVLSGFDIESIKADRILSCKIFVENNPINLLLKGKDTLVVNDQEVYVNKSGSSALATAGSGDCLTGILLALLGRQDSFDMLKLAAYIHGLSGDFASRDLGEDSVIASDIIDYLPKVLKALRKEAENDNQSSN